MLLSAFWIDVWGHNTKYISHKLCLFDCTTAFSSMHLVEAKVRSGGICYVLSSLIIGGTLATSVGRFNFLCILCVDFVQ